MIEGADTVLTFDPHPLEVLHPTALPKLIMPFAVKRDVIEGLGVRELVVIPFDASSQRCRPRISSRRYWSSSSVPSGSRSVRTSASAPGREGDPEMLAARPEFETRVGAAGRGRRRDRLLYPDPGPDCGGDMVGARRCLGAPFMIEGTVVSGDQRGRELGFPTANIVPDDRLAIPGHGVYAAFADGVPGGGQRRRPADL